LRVGDVISGDVLVIGDVMLDVYIRGIATRLSPEAPIPIVDVTSEEYAPGGAGNVALNLARLGCHVKLFGACGMDDAGSRLSELLVFHGIEPELFLVNAMTPMKTRIVASDQQLVRFDREEMFNVSSKQLLTSVIESVSQGKFCAVVLSDYNKGILSYKFCQSFIKYCNVNGIPVLVDPKRGDWCQYRGAYLVKPNLKEFCSVVKHDVKNDSDVVSCARVLLDEYNLGAILVTMGKMGMILIERDKEEKFIKAEIREVFDVSGAGDTAIATLAACLCSGFSLHNAAKIANAAAGLVVGKLGTSTVCDDELTNYVSEIVNEKVDFCSYHS